MIGLLMRAFVDGFEGRPSKNYQDEHPHNRYARAARPISSFFIKGRVLVSVWVNLHKELHA